MLGAMSLRLLHDQEIFFAYRANYTTFPTKASRPNLAIFLAVLKGLEEWKGGRLVELHPSTKEELLKQTGCFVNNLRSAGELLTIRIQIDMHPNRSIA